MSSCTAHDGFDVDVRIFRKELTDYLFVCLLYNLQTSLLKIYATWW